MWFGLAERWEWIALTALCLALSGAALLLARFRETLPFLHLAAIALPALIAAGCLTVWAKSALVGQPAIARPEVVTLDARVLETQEQAAKERTRLIVAARLPGQDRPVKVRLNLDDRFTMAGIGPGGRIRVRARLMPPAPPMLPGGYDFARAAWFAGLAATGSVIGRPTVVEPGRATGTLSAIRARLAWHVRQRLPGADGAIAATLASGDRGAIPEGDAQAMRDAGLAHLLAISGLHVTAVIALAYALAIRALALWPWLALRVRLPLLAAGGAACAGIGYTLLTGAQVPTVRACVGALLVLAAIAMGREALSLRVLAVAAFIVLLLWPESLVGPSFQMSLAAVMAIIALGQSEWMRRFLAPREGRGPATLARRAAALLASGVVIELALMPIGLYHFHRAGAYGALANVIAIPLTTLVIMPLIALSLLLDIVGWGAPFWWLTGSALDLLLGLAHWVASRPGAVTLMPAMGLGTFLLFVSGGIWLALWQGRRRLAGLIPVALGTIGLATLAPPDILVTADGRHAALPRDGDGRLLVLRGSKSDFMRGNLADMAGARGEPLLLSQWPGARCNRDFCAVTLRRGARDWQVLMARSDDNAPERALAAACGNADIVIADRWLPRSCQPKWLKADRRMLSRTGGLAIDLADRHVETVNAGRGEHGW